MKGWEVKRLGEVSEIMYGHTAKSSKEIIGPKYLRITDIQDNNVDWTNVPNCTDLNEIIKYRLKNGDIVFARTGATTGKSFLIMNIPDAVFASYLIRVRIRNKKIDPVFLYNFFQSPKYWLEIENGITGSAQGGFNASKLADIKISVPPLHEQQQIVSILDQAFAAIDQAKTNVQKNLANAKELFQSELNAVFSKKGEGWVEKKLGEVLQKTETIDPTKQPHKEFIYIDVSSINRETLAIENANRIFGKDAPSRARKLVRRDDIIFATVRPTLKRIAIVGKEYDEQVCSTGYFVLRAEKLINNNLIFYYLQSDAFQSQMEKLQKGASYPAVIDSEVRSQIISFPISIVTQHQLVTRLNDLSFETKKLEKIYQQKLTELEELKKSILQKAFNGELSVGSSFQGTTGTPVTEMLNLTFNSMGKGKLSSESPLSPETKNS